MERTPNDRNAPRTREQLEVNNDADTLLDRFATQQIEDASEPTAGTSNSHLSHDTTGLASRSQSKYTQYQNSPLFRTTRKNASLIDARVAAAKPLAARSTPNAEDGRDPSRLADSSKVEGAGDANRTQLTASDVQAAPTPISCSCCFLYVDAVDEEGYCDTCLHYDTTEEPTAKSPATQAPSPSIASDDSHGGCEDCRKSTFDHCDACALKLIGSRLSKHKAVAPVRMSNHILGPIPEQPADSMASSSTLLPVDASLSSEPSHNTTPPRDASIDTEAAIDAFSKLALSTLNAFESGDRAKKPAVGVRRPPGLPQVSDSDESGKSPLDLSSRPKYRLVVISNT